MRLAPALSALAALLAAGPARAHGIWGHVHVTGWAVENMPDDELRAFLLDDPEVFNALLFGAVFTDTGYAVDAPASRAYSEHTHWEPFIEDYVQWIRDHDPPPWDSLESKKRVAFLMGCASHGLQDTLFDSLFLHQVEARDGAGQSETDPGTDGFLALDGHIRFIPEADIPLSTVLELYEVLDEEVTAEVIQTAVDRTTGFYVNGGGGLAVARTLGEQYAETMPWGRQHYLDAAVPGSLRAEVFPTMRYQQALWARLHDDLPVDDVTVYAFPEAPRRLRSGDPSEVDSWISLVFGQGVVVEDGLVALEDASGQPVAFTQAGNRWGGDPTRLLRLQPDEALAPGGWYTARLLPGATTIDGRVTTQPWSLTFQVDCETTGDPDCPELEDVPEAVIDGLPEEAEAADTGAETPAAPSGAETAAGCGCAAAPTAPRTAAPLTAAAWGLMAVAVARRRV